MQTSTPSPQLQKLLAQYHPLEALKPKGYGFPDIRFETRTHVPTDVAAYWLSRKNQTMRLWALTGKPIAPRRVNGRLAWAVVDIKFLLGI